MSFEATGRSAEERVIARYDRRRAVRAFLLFVAKSVPMWAGIVLILLPTDSQYMQGAVVLIYQLALWILALGAAASVLYAAITSLSRQTVVVHDGHLKLTAIGSEEQRVPLDAIEVLQLRGFTAIELLHMAPARGLGVVLRREYGENADLWRLPTHAIDRSRLGCDVFLPEVFDVPRDRLASLIADEVERACGHRPAIVSGRIRSTQAAEPPRCVSCGYDLRGLPAEAACPECGTPVVETTQGTAVGAAARVRQMRRGAGLLAVAGVLWIAVVLCSEGRLLWGMATGVRAASVEFMMLARAVDVLCGLALAFGGVWITVRDYGVSYPAAQRTLGAALRVVCIAGAVVISLWTLLSMHWLRGAFALQIWVVLAVGLLPVFWMQAGANVLSPRAKSTLKTLAGVLALPMLMLIAADVLSTVSSLTNTPPPGAAAAPRPAATIHPIMVAFAAFRVLLGLWLVFLSLYIRRALRSPGRVAETLPAS